MRACHRALSMSLPTISAPPPTPRRKVELGALPRSPTMAARRAAPALALAAPLLLLIALALAATAPSRPRPAAPQRRLSCAESLGFHPDISARDSRLCTNDLNFPDAWLQVRASCALRGGARVVVGTCRAPRRVRVDRRLLAVSSSRRSGLSLSRT